jgi:hypothetical protein
MSVDANIAGFQPAPASRDDFVIPMDYGNRQAE